MTDGVPTDPLEGQGPQDPLGDPMLDALERSMENPPGLSDLLASSQEPLADDLSRQLDRVEGSIENMLPMPPPCGTGNASELPDVTGDDPVDPEPFEVTDATYAAGDDMSAASPGTQASLSSDDSLGPGGADPGTKRMRPRGAGASRRPKSAIRRRRPGRKGRMPRGMGFSTRNCPETRRTTNQHDCEECSKYRHWPEGTDDEPKQCWHDWQDFIQSRKSSPNSDGSATR